MPELSSYTSFYRRFRPQRFSEVLGQDHVTIALRKSIVENRVSHAYLFSGPRGTGKTSTARILAKALNCENVSEGEPCCTCDSCLSITEGRSFDVEELDGASNSGIEAIRSLIATTSTSSAGNWKVYIIDEVHMLSTPASNALLKTLEEPPSHVIFVLATTDPQKILPTIMSRTQHYEFKFLSEKVLKELVESIQTKAELSLDNEALTWLIRKGDGSARDTLSYLDQVAALGYVPDSRPEISRMVDALASQDVGALMDGLDAILRSGQTPTRICTDLIALFREGFLRDIGASDAQLSFTELPFDSRWLINAIRVLGGATGEMRDALDPRVILEVALVNLIQSGSDPALAELKERVAALERQVSLLSARGSEVNSPGLNANKDIPPNNLVPKPKHPTTPSAVAAGRQPDEPTTRYPKPDLSPAPQVRSLGNMDRLRSALTGAKGNAEIESKTEPKESGFFEDPGTSKVERGNDPLSGDLEVTKIGPANISDMASSVFEMDAKELNEVFRATILPSLAPRARSLYSASRVALIKDGKIVLSVPNEAHKAHAFPNLKDVQAEFRRHFADSTISLELTSDEVFGEVTDVNAETDVHAETDGNAELLDQFSNAVEAADGDAESQILNVFPGTKKIDQ